LRLIRSNATARAIFALVAAAAIFSACEATSRTSTSRDTSGAVMPNAALTPGDVLSTNVNEICVSGYAKRARDVSTATKNQVYAEYGIISRAPGEYEIDHLVPLGIGGSNDVKNLWPQPTNPRPGRLEKDALEDELHKRICDRSIDLRTAQSDIATDWVAAYRKYVQQR
jgi:hypothetical protein